MESISIEEFQRWQKNRVEEHKNEMKSLEDKISTLLRTVDNLQSASKRLVELSQLRNNRQKELLGRLEWAFEELLELPIDDETKENIELLKKHYGFK